MKIALAQTKSIKGDVDANIAIHKEFIRSAVEADADLIVFPELSLTGYEPAWAAALSTDSADPRFDEFQRLSDSHHITIGVGMPTKSKRGICISMILFQPQKSPLTYSKNFLHADEVAYFVAGDSLPIVKLGSVNIALAICYEISIIEHAEAASKGGAELYIASVAKHLDGIREASKRLSEIARTYSIPVLLSNCIGPSDNFIGAGMSGVWDSSGQLIKHLNEIEEDLLFYEM